MKQEWLLCDLHTHSEFSKINKSGDKVKVKEMSANEFVEILNEKKVKLFSVTDHNYFSKKFYDEIDDYIETKQYSMKVINGTELDTYVTLDDGSTDYIHVCIYFDDNVDREALHKLINSLYKDESGNELKPTFYDIISKLYDLKSKFIVVPHGDKSRGLFKVLRDFIPDEQESYNKYAMYKIFNAFDVRPQFFEKSASFWAKNFYERTLAFEKVIEGKSGDELKTIEINITAKIKDNKSVLTQDEMVIYSYMMSYGSYYAYFVFSDWHNATPYEPKINNFIFGRLDIAFESFEMATLDPMSRIEITTDVEIDIPPTILQRIEFKSQEDIHEIQFSPGLNAIVGKRGSGKSLLLAVIQNLVDKDHAEGAKRKYKSLNIKEISGENRGGIKVSEGGLSSVVFLTQDTIKAVFEKPETAQEAISSHFKEIADIDLSEINKMIEIGRKIIPYNKNYKNITANILSIKISNDYNYTEYVELVDSKVKQNFKNAISNLKELEKDISELHLDNGLINDKINEIEYLKKYYLKLVEEYNAVFKAHNSEVKKISVNKTNNQIAIKQNNKDIREAISNINRNFEIILNVEKLRVILKGLSLDNPPVEIVQKGKYLFVTYFEIPEDIKAVLEEKIIDSITRGSQYEDIIKYINGDPNRKLKSNLADITTNLSKYITAGIFKSKKEFYEIKDNSVNYIKIIHNMNDLKLLEEKKSIINLTKASPGMKSVAYLDMLFDLEESILILDQPEDNIDNDYISNYLVPNIKRQKRIKQLIFVTHNPSVAVYGDAFNYIYVENSDKIKYINYLIERKEDKERLIKILEGGKSSFSNRNKKFGNILGEEEYGNN